MDALTGGTDAALAGLAELASQQLAQLEALSAQAGLIVQILAVFLVYGVARFLYRVIGGFSPASDGIPPQCGLMYIKITKEVKTCSVLS